MNEDTRRFFEKLAGVDSSNNKVEEEKEEEAMESETVSEPETSPRVDSMNLPHVNLQAQAAEFEPQLVKAVKKEREEIEEDDFGEGDGKLVIDVYQTANDIVIEAPVAGVSADDVDLEISPESVTIKGRRVKTVRVEKKDYLHQECYWGKFSRTVILPQEIDADNATATFKNGVLKIALPKVNKTKTKKVKVKFE